jgi:hypothetical protein
MVGQKNQMDNPDTRFMILALCDTHNLHNLSQINKDCYQLLSKKIFWKQVSENYRVPFNNQSNYNLPVDWYSEFVDAKNCIDLVNKLLTKLNPKIIFLKSFEEITEFGLTFHIADIDEIDNFDFPGIGIFKMQCIKINSYPKVRIYYDQNKFIINFICEYQGILNFKYSISKGKGKKLLFKLLLNGMLPDGYIGLITTFR